MTSLNTKQPRNLTTQKTLKLAVSKDNARPALNHIHSEPGRLVSVDGYRAHLSPSLDAVECEHCKKNELTFPDIDQVMPKETHCTILVDAQEFRTALTRAGVFVHGRTVSERKDPTLNYSDMALITIGDMKNDHGYINVTGRGEHGSTTTTVSAAIEFTMAMKQLYFGVNWEYLRDAIDHVSPKGGTVTLKLRAHNHPVIVEGESDNTALVMVMDPSGSETCNKNNQPVPGRVPDLVSQQRALYKTTGSTRTEPTQTDQERDEYRALFAKLFPPVSTLDEFDAAACNNHLATQERQSEQQRAHTVYNMQPSEPSAGAVTNELDYIEINPKTLCTRLYVTPGRPLDVTSEFQQLNPGPEFLKIFDVNIKTFINPALGDFDIVFFDDWIKANVHNYEDGNTSLRMFLSSHYGPRAAELVENLIKSVPVHV